MHGSLMLVGRRSGYIVMMTMHRSLSELREREVVLLIPAGVMIDGHVKAQCQCARPRGDPESH